MDIRNHNAKLSSISVQAGFTDYARFSKLFLRETA